MHFNNNNISNLLINKIRYLLYNKCHINNNIKNLHPTDTPKMNMLLFKKFLNMRTKSKHINKNLK